LDEEVDQIFPVDYVMVINYVMVIYEDKKIIKFFDEVNEYI
jgi:hypothetical protein